jgi:hypothetical protein
MDRPTNVLRSAEEELGLGLVPALAVAQRRMAYNPEATTNKDPRNDSHGDDSDRHVAPSLTESARSCAGVHTKWEGGTSLAQVKVCIPKEPAQDKL